MSRVHSQPSYNNGARNLDLESSVNKKNDIYSMLIIKYIQLSESANDTNSHQWHKWSETLVRVRRVIKRLAAFELLTRTT